MNKSISTSHAPVPIGPYSQAVAAGGFLFVSGQISIDPETGDMANDTLENETSQVMNNIRAILKEASMDFSHVVKTTIFLSDMNFFGTVNRIYSACFKEPFPARETVEVSRLPKEARVEISVIAFKE